MDQCDVHIHRVQVVTKDKIHLQFKKVDTDKGCCLVFVNSAALFSH